MPDPESLSFSAIRSGYSSQLLLWRHLCLVLSTIMGLTVSKSLKSFFYESCLSHVSLQSNGTLTERVAKDGLELLILLPLPLSYWNYRRVPAHWTSFELPLLPGCHAGSRG